MWKAHKCPCVKGFGRFGSGRSDGCRYAPKPRALPAELHPVMKLKGLTVCSQPCGQRCFCADLGNRKESRKCRCYKALRRFTLPVPDTATLPKPLKFCAGTEKAPTHPFRHDWDYIIASPEMQAEKGAQSSQTCENQPNGRAQSGRPASREASVRCSSACPSAEGWMPSSDRRAGKCAFCTNCERTSSSGQPADCASAEDRAL